jgi:hypothetical protein
MLGIKPIGGWFDAFGSVGSALASEMVQWMGFMRSRRMVA